MKREIIPAYKGLSDPEEIKAVYLSQNKIEAMEDTVTFAPQLYRL